MAQAWLSAFKFCPDGLFQFRRFRKLFLQRGGEPFHLLLERLAVVFDFLRAHVAAGREDVAVRADFFQLGGFAEAGLRPA